MKWAAPQTIAWRYVNTLCVCVCVDIVYLQCISRKCCPVIKKKWKERRVATKDASNEHFIYEGFSKPDELILDEDSFDGKQFESKCIIIISLGSRGWPLLSSFSELINRTSESVMKSFDRPLIRSG